MLESVLIHPDARSAIISGEHLMLGQKIRRHATGRIGETEVVLLEGGERRTLKLLPGCGEEAGGSARRRARSAMRRLIVPLT